MASSEAPAERTSREVWRLALESTEYVDPFGLAVGPEGRIAVVGQLRGDLVIAGAVDATYGYGTRSFVLELNADGSYRWHQVLEGLVTEVTTVGYGASGAIVIGGTAMDDFACERRGPKRKQSNLFVASYDGAGVRRWCRVIGGTEYASSARVATTPSGAIWAASEFTGTVNLGGRNLKAGEEGNVLVVKLDASGEHLVSRQLGSNEAHLHDLAGSRDEGAVLSGRYTGPMRLSGGGELPYPPRLPDAEVASPASYVVRLDGDGGIASAWRFGGRGQDPVVHSVSPHSSGALLLGGRGSFSHRGKPAALGDADSFAAAFTPSGDLVFTRGAAQRTVHGVAVALDPAVPHLRGVVVASRSTPAPPGARRDSPVPHATLTIVDELDPTAAPLALGDGWVNDVTFASRHEVVLLLHEHFAADRPSRHTPLRALVMKRRLP